MSEFEHTQEILHPVDSEKWEQLQNEIESRIERSEKRHGITTSYIVQDDAITARRSSQQPDLPMFGASLGKLPLAEAMISMQCPPDLVVSWKSKDVDTTGDGVFDKRALLKRLPNREYRETAGNLLYDMLSPRSGNTPVRVFADHISSAKLSTAGLLNYIYDAMGMRETRVMSQGESRFYMWGTTAQESLDSFKRLLDPVDPEDPMSQIAIAALGSSEETTKYGTWPYVASGDRLRLWRKHGEYNGDTDEEWGVPFIVRHEVGTMKNNKNQQLSYAFLTRADINNRKALLFMDTTLGMMGESVAHALGYNSRLLGKAAMQDTLSELE